MNLAGALEGARQDRLYPAVILHGGADCDRRTAALTLARTLLCDAAPQARPCGACRHCRRLALAGAGGEGTGDAERFHPDFLAIERDLKTSTSVEAAKRLVQGAQVSPFEARGQVFVVAAAETLTGEAANALLKALEEPGARAPRHFLLLAPSQFDLLPTLRSRSLAVFLGPGAAIDPQAVAAVAASFGRALEEWTRRPNGVLLLAAAAALAGAGEWDDPRAGRPWAVAASAVVATARRPEVAPVLARALLALAEDLLAASAWRSRGISAERILEGLVARRLALVRNLLGTGRNR